MYPITYTFSIAILLACIARIVTTSAIQKRTQIIHHGNSKPFGVIGPKLTFSSPSSTGTGGAYVASLGVEINIR